MGNRLWLTIALSACVGAAARADDSNFRPYLIGSRAAGMGGAFTALGDDGSGGYYNPGGLAFSRRSSISLIASVYGIETGSYAGALANGRDFDFHDLNLAPVMTSFVLKLGPADVDTGVPKHTLALAVFVPDSLNNDDRDSNGSPQNAFFITQKIQTIWAGAAYALRLGPVGLGIAAYGLIGTSTGQLDYDFVNPTNPSQFFMVTFRTDISTLAAVGGLGIRVDATDELSFGFSAYSPAIGTGKRRVFFRLAQSQVLVPQPLLVAEDREGLDGTPTLPLRLQLGTAWQRKPWTVAADLVLLGPRDVTDNPDQASAGFGRHVVRQTVINGSFGGEYLIGSSFPLRFGAFTDFAASRTPTATGSDVSNTDHVNRYGLTASIGYLGEHVHTDVGLIGAYGKGSSVIPEDLLFTRLRLTDVKTLSAYFFIATSYGF